VVLDTRDAQQLFDANDVLLVRADWTRYDPEITESLAALGRNSVPVYAFYPAGGREVILLPQVLSMTILRNLFDPSTNQERG
jgi:thiol:disulfide interchange protein DsbD